MSVVCFVASVICFVLALLGVSVHLSLTILGLAFMAAGHLPWGPVVIRESK